MVCTENQFILVNTLLSYRTRVKADSLPHLITYVTNNTDALKLNIKGNVIFSINESVGDILSLELLLPVDNDFASSTEFIYKPRFRLENAVKVRHYGEFSALGASLKVLQNYLVENSLKPITEPYYVVVRNNEENPSECVTDIYMGVNGNIL